MRPAPVLVLIHLSGVFLIGNLLEVGNQFLTLRIDKQLDFASCIQKTGVHQRHPVAHNGLDFGTRYATVAWRAAK